MALVESLVDPFNGTSLNTGLWTQTLGHTTTMSYNATGASVNMPSTTNASDIGQLTSNATYDFTGSSITLHTVTALNVATAASESMLLYIDGNNFTRIVAFNGNIYFQINKAAAVTTVASIAYSATTHAYWRMSESTNVVTWWTSSDGVSWTSQGTFTHGMTLTAMAVWIRGMTTGVVTSPGTFKFNLLNNVSGTLQMPLIVSQAINRSYTY